MYKIVLITASMLVALGWIAYGIWRVVTDYYEKKRPKPKPMTEHLQKVRGEFDDYTKKMQEFYKKKPFERTQKGDEEKGKE
jgi:hypothetical protein